MCQTPTERVQERFDELKKGSGRLLSDLGDYEVFLDLELQPQVSVWLIKIRTNEYPYEVFAQLGSVVDEINIEEDFTFLLTLENPK